jgi:hypothetical protein
MAHPLQSVRGHSGPESYVVRMPLGWMRFWFLLVMPMPAYLVLVAYVWNKSPSTGLTGLIATVYFVACGGVAYWFLAERRKYPDGVVAAVDEAGVYLGGPPRRIPWSQVDELIVGGLLDPESGNWTSFLVAVPRAPGSRASRRRTVVDPRTLGVAQDLPRSVDVAALRAVVRRYARRVTVHEHV